MYPPVVVRSNSDGKYQFMHIVVLDSYGGVLEHRIAGSTSASPQTLEVAGGGNSLSGPSGSSGSGTSQAQYTVFPRLSFYQAGTYRLQVSFYKAGDNGFILSGQVSTREIHVYEVPIALENPSKSKDYTFSKCITVLY
jgi:hypothetical protein